MALLSERPSAGAGLLPILAGAWLSTDRRNPPRLLARLSARSRSRPAGSVAGRRTPAAVTVDDLR